MPITLVASALDVLDNGTSPALNTTGANLLIANLGWYTSGALSATMTDSKGNTWTALASSTASYTNRQWYCLNPTVGTGHTFAASSFNAQGHMSVRAFAGVASLVDSKALANDSATGTIQPGTVTPTVDGSLIVTGSTYAASGTPVVPTGYTGSTRPYDGSRQGGGSAHLIQGTAAAVNPTWLWTPTVVNWGAASVAAFAPTVAPATPGKKGGGKGAGKPSYRFGTRTPNGPTPGL